MTLVTLQKATKWARDFLEREVTPSNISINIKKIKKSDMATPSVVLLDSKGKI